MKKIQFYFVIVAIAFLSYQTGLAQDKLTAQDWLQRGRVIMAESSKEHLMEALSDFNKSIDIDPTNAEVYYERGLLNAYLLFNQNAFADMRKAAKLGHKGAQKWLSHDLEEKGREKAGSMMRTEAVPEYERAQKSLAAGTGEIGEENKYFDLSEYMPSRSKPMIHFDFDMSNIKQQYYAILDEVAMVLKEKIPEAKIVLAGYTDSIGTETYNDKLSLRRAQAVESYLVEHDVAPDRIIVKGYGENYPIDTNETNEGRAKNRRAEILNAKE
ncbi:MAG: OmpA family protein [Syntrophales bacterium]|jgi:outer membrane protein OmpA-like peptidoglycan-associated protein